MAAFNYAPREFLDEHLNYFNDAIASKNLISDGDFDAIFGSDFDLVFDPLVMTANPVPLTDSNHLQGHHNSNNYSHGHSGCAPPTMHHTAVHMEPIPFTIPSNNSSFHAHAPSAPQQQHHHQQQPLPMTVPSTTYPQSPAVLPKPVVSKKTMISKVAPAIVSPISVTAVFEEIPQPQVKKPAAVEKSSPRKRSFSMVESKAAAKPAPARVTAAAQPAPVSSEEANMSFEEQEDLRRERNRHHAKKSRQRKRDYMNQLEDAVNDMRKENERLFELLGMDSQRAQRDMAEEEERRAAIATEKFIVGLKQPRNRVLDNTTLAFLRELWK